MDRRKHFIILLGLVSFFADMTYEGARSIAGPFLLDLGASAAIVGIVSGLGEFVGYSFRLLSGIMLHRSGKLWRYANMGYGLNLVAVPLLAFCGSWMSAGLLLILERLGKGIRIPPRDTMISFASLGLGRGYAFGLHSFFDQLGAVSGPLVVSFILFSGGSWSTSFAWLALPAACSFMVLGYAQKSYKEPRTFEMPESSDTQVTFPKSFWTMLAGLSLIGCGFVDFSLISYHLLKIELVARDQLPLFYALGMACVALSSPKLGKLFDRLGMQVLLVLLSLSALSPFLTFSYNVVAALCGMVLWGVGYALQAAIVPALIAKIIPPQLRAKAYGVFYCLFGFSWFVGSSFMGFLYQLSPLYLALFSFACTLSALPILGIVKK